MGSEASFLYNEGQKEEQRLNWNAAYEFYRRANNAYSYDEYRRARDRASREVDAENLYKQGESAETQNRLKSAEEYYYRAYMDSHDRRMYDLYKRCEERVKGKIKDEENARELQSQAINAEEKKEDPDEAKCLLQQAITLPMGRETRFSNRHYTTALIVTETTVYVSCNIVGEGEDNSDYYGLTANDKKEIINYLDEKFSNYSHVIVWHKNPPSSRQEEHEGHAEALGIAAAKEQKTFDKNTTIVAVSKSSCTNCSKILDESGVNYKGDGGYVDNPSNWKEKKFYIKYL